MKKSIEFAQNEILYKQPLIEYKNNSHRHNYTQNLELWLSMIRGLNMGHNNENTIENISLYKT